MQEIPRTADHAPSRTMYTWRVDTASAAEKLAADLYKAALNVRLRLEFELNQQTDVSVLLTVMILLVMWHCTQAMHHLEQGSRQGVHLLVLTILCFAASVYTEPLKSVFFCSTIGHQHMVLLQV